MAKNLYEKLEKLIETVELDLTPDNAKALSKFMKSDKVQEEIAYYEKIDYKVYQDQIEELRDLVNGARILYEYTGLDTGMTDTTYDILYSRLVKLDKKQDITPMVEEKGVTKVNHRYPSLRGTIDKVYALTFEDRLDNKSQESLDEWMSRAEQKITDKVHEHTNLNYADVLLFPKFDGVSCVFEFDNNGNLQRALTRGSVDTNTAKDITHIFPNVTGPYKNAEYPYAQKTEIMMTNEDFARCNEEYGTKYKQSRSLVSSIINSDTLDGREQYLKIVPLRWSSLIDGEEGPQRLAPGVYDYPYKKCKLRDRDEIRAFAEQVRTVNGLRTDGIVIYLLDPDYQKALGRDHHKQKFEVAYKFTEEIGYTIVKDIHFSIGSFGTLTPIVNVRPIELKGNTISSPSIGNYGRFQQLQLAKGDVVKIIYDIIPYLTYDANDPNCSRSGKRPIPPPLKCEECDSYLEERNRANNTLDLVCPNPDCPAKEKGRILNYLTRLGIDNVGESMIQILYDAGYLTSIVDLYDLEYHRKDLVKLPTLGKKSVDYLLTMLEAKRDIYASTFMSAIGIKGLSIATFREVFRNIGFKEFIDLCINDPGKAEGRLCDMKGIRIKTSDRIIAGVNRYKNEIFQLEDQLIIHDDPKTAEPTFKVAFSKVRDPELEKSIIKAGGEVSDSLTNDCSLLIVPSTAIHSSKMKKARDKDIPILVIDEAWKYITDHFLT